MADNDAAPTNASTERNRQARLTNSLVHMLVGTAMKAKASRAAIFQFKAEIGEAVVEQCDDGIDDNFATDTQGETFLAQRNAHWQRDDNQEEEHAAPSIGVTVIDPTLLTISTFLDSVG